MEYSRTSTKVIRLTQIQHFLHQNPRGLTSRDLSKLCKVGIRTIQRDLCTLETDLGIPITQQGDRYGILDTYILPPVSFSLYEAMALFLASRLILRQVDVNNHHIETAISKLAGVLPPALSQRINESIRAIHNKASDPEYVHIFEQVAIGWSTQRKMTIEYRSLQSTESKQWLLEPYFIDMTGVGYSTYVIGQARREGKEGIIIFKLDRIQKVELLDESFQIPEGLSLEKLLGSSWGIMSGDEAEIRLKFSPQVTRRVKESVWHESQKIVDAPDGGCFWTAKVGNPLEMTPWIRGWGPDVEVIEPQELREEFREYARKLHHIYCEG